MESGDLLEEKIKQEEKVLKEKEQQVAADLKRLEEEEGDLQTEKKQQEASRKEVESSLQPDLVSEFTKIAQARGGLAVSRVVDGLCRGCSVRIRPHVLQQIRRHEGLFHCDNCRRYLYHVEEKGAETPPGE